MIYITFDRKHCPCMSVKTKILPPDILFHILVFACPIFGFLVLAHTAIPVNGAATLTACFRIFVPRSLCSSNNLQFTFHESAFKHVLFWSKSDLLLTITFWIVTHVM